MLLRLSALVLVLSLAAICISTAISRLGGQDRCNEWVPPRSMWLDEVARCAAKGSIPAQLHYGLELFQAGQRDEAGIWFEAAIASSKSAFGKGEIAKSIASSLETSTPIGPGKVAPSERWYQRAFDLGSDTAAVLLGVRLQQLGDQQRADFWFDRSVERSAGRTATLIASNLTGRGDRPQTVQEADRRAYWLRRGAELGDHSSMVYYAEALSTGSGVEQNETEAFRGYEVAARHPQANAWDWIKLAELYADGKGTQPNLAAAAGALSSAKSFKRDSSDTVVSERIRVLEQRLVATGNAEQ